MVKLQDIDPSLTSDVLDIQTTILDNTFDWSFALKEGTQTSKEVLVKLKLVKNLTSG